MKRFKAGRILMVAALALSLIGGHAQAYTATDVETADEAKLKLIANDAETALPVRRAAVQRLPIAEQKAYLAAAWLNQEGRNYIAWTLDMAGALETSQYPELIVGFVAEGNYAGTYAIQTGYVKSLLRDGDTKKAVAESKRLLGLTPMQEDTLLRTINLTASTLKSDALKDKKSVKDAIAAMNSYLQAISDKNVSNHPFTKLAFPASPAGVAALETNKNVTVATIALLYGGKYAAAATKGNELLTAASTSELIQSAIALLSGAANGKAGLPDAANDVTG